MIRTINPFDFLSLATYNPREYRFIDEDKYDIVPKKSYIEQQITEKKELISILEERIAQVNKEIKSLQKRLE